MFITKKINIKFAYIDSLIYVVIFITPSLFLDTSHPSIEALLITLFVFIIPITYNILKKKYFIKNNMYVGIYYPVVEFFVLFLSLIGMWFLSHYIFI